MASKFIHVKGVDRWNILSWEVARSAVIWMGTNAPNISVYELFDSYS